MDIILYVTTSEKQQINKTLIDGVTFTGSLRSESSVIKPSFLLEITNPSSYNYCYIAEFNRYYLITDIVSIRTGLWRIDCTVDVLMSFRNQILALNVIVDRASSDSDTYMSGDVWNTTVKTKTDIINFPSGLLDSGEYILITSGGLAT